MQENTSRAGLPAWIFFILAMIAVIGFVVFQQNRPSDMPPEASVQPPEQPVNKAIETVKDLAAKAVEIADSSKISAEDADETPQETESALENGASAKAETVAEAPQAVADRDDSVDQKQAEVAIDSPEGLAPEQSKAEVAAEETRVTEATKAPAAAEEEAEIVVEDAAAGGEAEALRSTGAAEAETDMSKTTTADADAEAEPENLQKQSAADVANPAEAPATKPAAKDVDATGSDQTREETTQAATKEATDLPAKEEKPLARVPQIETIRIEADGAVLIAGLVGPNQAVDVLVNDVALLTLYADGSGNFAGFFDLPYSSELRVIRLRVGTAEPYVFSDQDVLVLPTQIAAPLPEASETSDEAEIVLAENAEATSEATASDQSQANETSQGLDASGLSAKSSSAVSVAGDEDSDNQSASEGETTESARADLESPKVPTPADAAAAKAAETPKIADSKPEETASAQPPSEAPVKSLADATVPPKVLIADKDGVRVVQSDDNLDQDAFALDAISYDEDGQVMLSGRSNPMAYLRIYLDNAPVLLVRPDDEGNWKTLLSNVDPGVYTLRIDQVNAAGKVVSWLETPFKKESPQKLLTHIQDTKTEARINVVTVQPGYTLWAIARKRYGRGILYVRVFEANRDKIRDPDLIYPGQVFDLPD